MTRDNMYFLYQCICIVCFSLFEMFYCCLFLLGSKAEGIVYVITLYWHRPMLPYYCSPWRCQGPVSLTICVAQGKSKGLYALILL